MCRYCGIKLSIACTYHDVTLVSTVILQNKQNAPRMKVLQNFLSISTGYSVSVVSSFFVEGIENIKMVRTRRSKHLIVSTLVAEFGSFWGNILI